ncbi:MAG: acetoacetate--CoA ligase [Ilumatobacteraceae bacterium]
MSSSESPRVLWDHRKSSSTRRISEFIEMCGNRAGRAFADYDEFWSWSVTDGLSDFWAGVWQYFGLDSVSSYESVLENEQMPGARWFTGAGLNYAERALAAIPAEGEVIIGSSQSRPRIALDAEQLRAEVARVRAGLIELGVERGDRVAAYLPNIPETVIAFLATASLGAVWTSCAPEFGVAAVLDRFSQVEPKVLFVVDGYRYGRHNVDRSAAIQHLRDGLTSVTSTVLVPHLGRQSEADPTLVHWDQLGGDVARPVLEFETVPVDHPLYVLYSSGTTGLPKAIIHGHGLMLVEHLKALGLHADMGPGDRFHWFTTTGWMMWNYQVSGLLVGASLVLFDGDPTTDGPDTLWRMAADERITWFGAGSPWFSSCRRAGLTPAETFDLSALRAVGATGAPLPADAFRWIHDAVSPDVMISPISGGTDICSAFVGGNPLTPVWEGEIPTRYLGCAVESWDEDSHSLVGREGELVVTRPMPSMPVGFWGDDDGSRFRAAYFEHFPGVWRHGDWVTITERGSCVISGRSDATLNRGGVRVGTAEIYRVVEAVPGVVDSLVVHLEATEASDPGELVLFVALDTSHLVVPVSEIRTAVRHELSPRHVPDEVHAVESIPTTLSGKKLELPVKRILAGAAPDDVASRDALKNPDSLDAIAEIARLRR